MGLPALAPVAGNRIPRRRLPLNYHDLSLSLVDALLRSHTEVLGQRPLSASQHRPWCITISREAGALGNSVAKAIGKRLDWPVYDREILEKVGEEMRRSPRHLETVDERPLNWLEDCLSGFLNEYHVSADAYLKYLACTVRGLGTVGKCVIVGRGANYILPPATTLRVRLIASLEDRVKVIAGRFGLLNREAAAWVKKTERERIGFVKRYFGKDSTDPHHYDLVLNMSRVSAEEAAELIIQMLRHFEGRVVATERKQAGAAVPEGFAVGPQYPAGTGDTGFFVGLERKREV
jgi:cytidylate kinase